MQIENPELFGLISRLYKGKHLIEISRRGDGNQLLYVVGDEDSERWLWEHDNRTHKEGYEFIGMSISIKL